MVADKCPDFCRIAREPRRVELGDDIGIRPGDGKDCRGGIGGPPLRQKLAGFGRVGALRIAGQEHDERGIAALRHRRLEAEPVQFAVGMERHIGHARIAGHGVRPTAERAGGQLGALLCRAPGFGRGKGFGHTARKDGREDRGSGPSDVSHGTHRPLCPHLAADPARGPGEKQILPAVPGPCCITLVGIARDC